MAGRYGRKQEPLRNLSDDGIDAWHAAIRGRYGLSLRYENDVYLDTRRGFVYAGSEYVAKVDPSDVDDPERARDWTPSIGAFERRDGETILKHYARDES